ncbi:hypothetical protein BASA81_003165 [Batrachochytrium salamandrivorans]|nr:hypothetical protein BASA81_003165 [Batrachochytrium salamandrivorans]
MFAAPQAFALLLLLVSCTTQAVQLNILNSYNNANCAGTHNSTFFQGLSGLCIRDGRVNMGQMTCGTYKRFLNSTTCEGNFTIDNTTAGCQKVGMEQNLYFKYDCGNYPSVARVSFMDTCNTNFTTSLRLYIPLNMCIPSPSNIGGVAQENSRPQMWFKVTKADDKTTFFYYENGNCAGASNTSVTTSKGSCTNFQIPALYKEIQAVEITMYSDSAASALASSSLLLGLTWLLATSMFLL